MLKYETLFVNKLTDAGTRFIRSVCGQSGLPKVTLAIGLANYIVRWDRFTGEVKTIEYEK